MKVWIPTDLPEGWKVHRVTIMNESYMQSAHFDCVVADQDMPFVSASELPHMTNIARLRHALATLGWSQRDLARHLGYDDRTVRRWLSGAYEPAEGVLEWLEHGVLWMDGRPRRQWHIVPRARA